VQQKIESRSETRQATCGMCNVCVMWHRGAFE